MNKPKLKTKFSQWIISLCAIIWGLEVQRKFKYTSKTSKCILASSSLVYNLSYIKSKVKYAFPSDFFTICQKFSLPLLLPHCLEFRFTAVKAFLSPLFHCMFISGTSINCQILEWKISSVCSSPWSKLTWYSLETLDLERRFHFLIFRSVLIKLIPSVTIFTGDVSWKYN